MCPAGADGRSGVAHPKPRLPLLSDVVDTFLPVGNFSFLSLSPLPLCLCPLPSVRLLPLSLPSFSSSLSCPRGTGTHGRRSSGGVTPELDDEPPCMEEIDYSADSGSDQEGRCSELDRQIREWASHPDEGEEEEEGPGRGRGAGP